MVKRKETLSDIAKFKDGLLELNNEEKDLISNEEDDLEIQIDDAWRKRDIESLNRDTRRDLQDTLDTKPDIMLQTEDGLISFYELKQQLKDELFAEFKQTMSPQLNTKPQSIYDNLDKISSIFPGVGTIMKSVVDGFDFNNYVLYCKVKPILEAEGKTQKWLSQKTMIPQSSLSFILNNETSPSLEYAIRISMVMKKPISELFEYSRLDIVEE